MGRVLALIWVKAEDLRSDDRMMLEQELMAETGTCRRKVSEFYMTGIDVESNIVGWVRTAVADKD